MSKCNVVNCVCACSPDIDCRHCDGLGVAKQVGTDLRPLTMDELIAAAEASVVGLESTIDAMSVAPQVHAEAA